MRTAHWAGRTTEKNKSHTFLCKSMTFVRLVGGIVGAGHARPARGRQTSGNGEPAGRTCAAPTAQPWFSGAAYSKHTLRHSRPSHLQPGRNPSGRLRRPPPFDKGGSACQKTSTLLYRECRGDHWSPASLAQQRSFGKASHKANGHGRAMLAPTGVFRHAAPPFDKGGFYLLWINFLSSPCFTAALSTTQVRNTSMGSIVVFFTRPEVK